MLVDRGKEWDDSYKIEVVIFQIVFGMVHGQPYEGFQKSHDTYTNSGYLSLELWSHKLTNQ
jgi:hypothetical protein